MSAFHGRVWVAHCATPLQVDGSTKTGVQAPLAVMPIKLRAVWQKLGTQTAPGLAEQNASWQGSDRHRTPGSVKAHVTWFGITAQFHSRHAVGNARTEKTEGRRTSSKGTGGGGGGDISETDAPHWQCADPRRHNSMTAAMAQRE